MSYATVLHDISFIFFIWKTKAKIFCSRAIMPVDSSFVFLFHFLLLLYIMPLLSLVAFTLYLMLTVSPYTQTCFSPSLCFLIFFMLCFVTNFYVMFKLLHFVISFSSLSETSSVQYGFMATIGLAE